MSASDQTLVRLIDEISAAEIHSIPPWERRWRVRWLLMVWAATGEPGMAWTAATSPYEGLGDAYRENVGETPDHLIIERVRGRLDAAGGPPNTGS